MGDALCLMLCVGHPRSTQSNLEKAPSVDLATGDARKVPEGKWQRNIRTSEEEKAIRTSEEEKAAKVLWTINLV